MTDWALQLDGIDKQFFGVPVLRGVTLGVSRGEVLGLVGENGAGKSTLMNIVSGVLSPDGGSMHLGGEPFAPQSAADASHAGVAIVRQELNLFANLSVAENLRLANFPVRRGMGRVVVDRRELRRQARAALERVGLRVSVDRLAGRLTPGERQLLEIAKALQSRPRLILLDEPTTSLAAAECETLFGIIDALRRDGVAVVYISHNLADVRRLCDSTAVLRDGELQGVGPVAEFSLDRMISMMVGRSIDAVFPRRIALQFGDTALEVKHLTQPGVVHDVSFTLRQGEIVGVSGLMGSGRTELLWILFGLEPHQSGEVLLFGRPAARSPRHSIAAGMALVTESRRDDGLLLDSSAVANASLVALPRFGSRGLGWYRQDKATAACNSVLQSLQLRAQSTTNQPVRTLSGGNQQKVVLAKWLLARPRVILLDEPTRGVDVGVKTDIYRQIHELAAGGAAVLVVSSELEELIGLCDRLLVMAAGEVRGEARRDEFDRERLLRVAFGEERLT
ncbi:MAG: sugar ABC transporter ATP-binding protein [Pirellulales bacterium]|nr:sugar ABC transporter ATP-binding protein [Pirellulales bacterium]